MRRASLVFLFVLCAAALFARGQSESTWKVVDGGRGEVYFFTEDTRGCGMLSIDFINGQRVEYRVSCDQTIDTRCDARTSVHLSGGLDYDDICQETIDHEGVTFQEQYPFAFLSQLQRVDSIEIDVTTCDGKQIAHTFAVKGLSKVLKDHRIVLRNDSSRGSIGSGRTGSAGILQ